MRHDESGDSEDEPACVIGGERAGDIYVLNGSISMKLGRNIHHMSVSIAESVFKVSRQSSRSHL